MLLQRFEDVGLSQYSYAVGCEGAGEVAIIDPRRDVDLYLDFAAQRALRIRQVLETHIHADFASGARELAARSGAELCLSSYDRGEAYEVSFPHTPLADGDSLTLGRVRIEALHTPGHTPEHLAFLVFDGARQAEVPIAMLSGDFLFVGSLGRPDLLGEEAKAELARRLFASVRGPLAGLPDGLEIHPGHGAGSMCGAGMSGRPFSTLGYERLANPYLDPGLDEEAFLAQILGSVPPFPPYYRRMKELNSAGPPRLDGIPGGRPLDVEALARRQGEGAIVVDLRDPASFGRGHVPGALGIGIAGSFSTWAAWMVPYDRPILLVGRSDEELEAAGRGLVRVGLDRIEGHLEGGFEAWEAAGREVGRLTQLRPTELWERLSAGEEIEVLDVRAEAEWSAGRPPQARHLMGGWIEERLGELPARDRPLAVMCQGGYRSTVVASVLARHGWRQLYNVVGGMDAWRRAGLPSTS